MSKKKTKSAPAPALPLPVGALKIKPACRYVGGISAITMRREIEKNHIRPCRTLRHLLIPIAELDRWLAEGQR